MGLFGWLFGTSAPDIGRLEDDGDVEGLIEALEYEGKKSDTYQHLEIVADAAEALGNLGDARARKPLIAAIERVDGILAVLREVMPSIRWLSAEKRQEWADREKKTKEVVAEVRSKAREALAKLGAT